MITSNHISRNLHTCYLAILAIALLFASVPLASQAEPQVPSAASFEKSVLLSTGVNMVYVEKGDPSKTTLLFIHGFTDSWHSFEPLLELLPDNFHSVAVTLRGHGDSGKPDTGYALQDFANDVKAFIEIQNLEPCIVVGHSMGGLVAQQLVAAYPQLVKGLVLMATDASFADNPGMPEFALGIAAMDQPVTWQYAEAFQKSTCAGPVDQGLMNLWISESVKVPLVVWKQAVNGIMNTDFSNQLSAIKVPTLILAGGHDLFCPTEAQEYLKNGIPNSQLKIFEGLGHAVHWENPEAVSLALLDFLQRWW